MREISGSILNIYELSFWKESGVLPDKCSHDLLEFLLSRSRVYCILSSKNLSKGQIERAKSRILRTGIDLKGHAQGLRDNRLRDAFKTRIRNNLARLATQRHKFYTKRMVPC